MDIVIPSLSTVLIWIAVAVALGMALGALAVLVGRHLRRCADHQYLALSLRLETLRDAPPATPEQKEAQEWLSREAFPEVYGRNPRRRRR